MGDMRVPFYNVMNKILEEALVESGWSPLIKRQPVCPSPSPDPGSIGEMQKEHNMDDASVQTVNHDTTPTAVISKKSMGERRKERFWKEKQAAKNINNNYIYGMSNEPPNQSHSQASSACSQNNMARDFEAMMQVRRLMKQAAKNINNNYIYGMSNEPPNHSHSQASSACSLNNRKTEIPEELRLLLKQSVKEMPLLDLDGFAPSVTCSCEGPVGVIQCRMCGAQVKTNCFLHRGVGNDGSLVTRCIQPNCYSDKLIEMRNN